ncbi:MAG: hypothetical protein GWO20_15710 [Candidatus Korarchaeota archaeon]|nr:hypothetical protein [Candidatus Korarchaeota archaeon]NIU84842.1 hypothetical protein [Candidatus Thorarchaeota archaeon]NIW14860.1 hypothetical protein [Candidatus Thorarchaeota archaeon]
MVVASESGKTALKVAKALRGLDVNVVCVTAYAGVRRPLGGEWPQINGEKREKLEEFGVKILDEARWIFGCTFDYAFLKTHTPSKAIHMFLSRTMGYGFKTAVEIALIAADVGAVPTDEEVIAIAGTGRTGGGADCAIIIKPAHVYGGEFIDLEKGAEVKEILALPRLKFTDYMIRKIKESRSYL